MLNDARGNVLAAWGERCAGPGWSNDVIWVLRTATSGSLRLDAVQPADQTPAMRALLGASHEITRALLAEVANAQRG